MRLRADLFVAALLRRAHGSGAAAYLRHRGAPEAGAVFVKLDCLDGRAALFAPAPPSLQDDDGVRRFVRAHDQDWLPPADIEARLARQRVFDPDMWLIEIEDRQGRDFLDRG